MKESWKPKSLCPYFLCIYCCPGGLRSSTANMLAIDQTTEQECSGEWAHTGSHNISKPNLREAICNVKERVFSGTGEKDCELWIDTILWRSCSAAGPMRQGGKGNRQETHETVHNPSATSECQISLSMTLGYLLILACYLKSVIWVEST